MIGKCYRLFAALLLASVAACSGSSYGPTTHDGGNGGGGPTGSVNVGGGIQFVSRHNGSMNPAVDTIAVGATVTWTWSGALPHSVRSTGTPSFPSSDTRTGSGSYAVTFAAPGTYTYECAVHGAAMRGTIVVVGDAPTTASVADATGDIFGSGDSRWDITALSVARDTGGLTVVLQFTRPVISAVGFDSAAMYAVVDLDLDQNGATGRQSAVDEFRSDAGATGIRDERLLDLTRLEDDGSVPVLDSLMHVLGWAPSVIAGNTVTVRVRRSFLDGDDGYLNAAAIVGNRANPTDFIPQSGHLTLGGTTALNAPQPTAIARASHRSWATMLATRALTPDP